MNLPTTNYFYNITLFKRFYIFFCIIFSLIQFYLSSSLNDYLIVLKVFFLNLVTILYCFNNKNFFKFPISFFVIFLSSFISLGGCIFFKTLEFEHLSKGLYFPNFTIIFLSASILIIIMTHFFYVKNNLQNKKNIFYSINKKLGLFDINSKFLIFLGVISIIIMLFGKIQIQETTLTYTRQAGVPLWFSLSQPFFLFYIIPFALVFSKFFFKTEVRINKIFIIFLLFVVLIMSLGTNRRDVLFFGFLSVFFCLIIVFLLNNFEFKKKQKFNFLIILILCLFSYNKLIQFNYIYLYERGYHEGRSFSQNVISFKNSLKKSFDNKINFTNIKEEHFGEYSNYYKSIIYDRLSYIEYSDNLLFFINKIPKNSVTDAKKHLIGRIISIIPQPIINLFNKDFKKNKYIYTTTSSYLAKKYDASWNANNDIGSFIVENYLLFGNFFFLSLILFSLIYFYILDSFYDYKKKTISIFIILFFFTTSLQLGNIFSAASLDILTTNFRNITQTILFYIIIRKIFLIKIQDSK